MQDLYHQQYIVLQGLGYLHEKSPVGDPKPPNPKALNPKKGSGFSGRV